jgi:hypothetical protein
LPCLLKRSHYRLGAVSESLARWLRETPPEQSKILLQGLLHGGSPSALPELELYAATLPSGNLKQLADQTVLALRKRRD